MLRILFPALFLAMCCSAVPSFEAQADFDALSTQIKAARQLGDMDQADLLASRYLALAQQQAGTIEQGNAYYQLGRNAMERNNYPEAKQQLEQAIALLLVSDQQILLADAY